MATATAVIAVTTHPKYSTCAASPGIRAGVVYTDGNRRGMADVAIIDTIAEIRKAMHRGAGYESDEAPDDRFGPRCQS